MANNLYLIGMPGAGKTLVGRIAAKKARTDFFDVDAGIAAKCGMSIPEIFERFGEAYFRKIESVVLSELSERSGAVISCGGGAALFPENVAVMKRTGMIVLIDRDLKLIAKTADFGSRPLLRNGVPELEKLYGERGAVYHTVCDRVIENNSEAVSAAGALCGLIRGLSR